ncbi:hypothetical protein [Sedimenticola sp.]|uniref:hypothetical protein n=1 Tax=Sedimenticola sp. TaxID=1940285 RepID=UPI003D09D677
MNKYIEDLEEFIGVRKGFFQDAQMDDDWTMIIKLFSLFEAVTAVMIVEELNRPELLDPITSIQMGTTNNGKIAFVKSLQLLPDSYIKYIEMLGWLRNKFAHNISSSSHDLKDFLETISTKRRKECQKYLHRIKSTVVNEDEISGNEFFNDNPKIAIFLTGQQVLEYMRQRIITGQQAGRIRKQQAKEYIEENGPIKISAYEFQLEKIR